ncbi:MAG: Ig domain-containing protein [Candidatus Korobacteraceae bacterium]
MRHHLVYLPAMMLLMGVLLPGQVVPGPVILPDAVIHRQYSFQLPASDGTFPWNWRLLQGSLPAGLSLSPDGTISGAPSVTGMFRIQVEGTDSSTPHRRIVPQIEIRVYPALAIQWHQEPTLQPDRLFGGVEVTSHIDAAVDLTVIVVAVNEIGKAFALGYQHFPFRRGSLVIPFESSLPSGNYLVHADAVGEDENSGAIYRTRLQTQSPLVVP